MSTRRASLVGVGKNATTNAGLWLDKYIVNQAREDTERRRELVREVCDIPMPSEYERWFERWKKALEDFGAKCREAEVQGRMVVGLGGESVLETAVTLHRTYGVPYIPGTALKGVAASFARQHLGTEWQPGSPAYEVVFGTTEKAGYITFFDAMPLPENRLLYTDVIAVHHPDYYQGKGKPPADWDNPEPIPFISATGKYLVALAGPYAWVEKTFEILHHALRHLGVGARTSSGYGRLLLNLGSPTDTPNQPVDPAEKMIDQLIEQIRGLKSSKVPGSINAFYDQWLQLEVGPEDKRRVAEAIVAKIKEAGREKQSRSQEWYQELLKSLGQKE
ncbi:type III-B CRISPR module RAMP protein Cmr6 [Desulfothermobacter acidiphilus]|uniref:type III-B CRISPR module RAMP protein Cmr6 n=1 Tax=Desulfothermobacter acidiphilus TaxID=1938353 RepID=UPI003F8BEBA4